MIIHSFFWELSAAHAFPNPWGAGNCAASAASSFPNRGEEILEETL